MVNLVMALASCQEARGGEKCHPGFISIKILLNFGAFNFVLKLGISLDKKTIRNIIDNYRRRGKIKKSLSWKQFLSAQANSIMKGEQHDRWSFSPPRYH
jgi:hypothetical protein